MDMILEKKMLQIKTKRDSSKPIYQQLKTAIKHVLLDNDIPAGLCLPSLRKLSENYSVSYLTMTKSINELVNDGFLEARKGSGVYVAKKIMVSKPIAIFLGDYREGICAQLLHGMVDVFEQKGVSINPFGGFVPSKIRNTLRKVLPLNKLGGVVGFAHNLVEDDVFLKELSSQVPVVLVNSIGDYAVDGMVYSDDRAGMNAIVDDLNCKNHKKVIFMGSHKTHSVGNVRLELFQKRAEKYGINYEVINGIEDMDSAYCQTLKLITEKHDFSAIVCWSDIVAAGVIKLLNRNNIKIPDEIAVSGFGNLDFADKLNPSLTTVEQNFEQMGRTAADILCRAIRKRSCNNPIINKIKTNFIVREST
jgi:GntR family transcriptional regulator, arabinose operon transcriptional repressor